MPLQEPDLEMHRGTGHRPIPDSRGHRTRAPGGVGPGTHLLRVLTPRRGLSSLLPITIHPLEFRQWLWHPWAQTGCQAPVPISSIPAPLTQLSRCPMEGTVVPSHFWRGH